MSIMVIVKCTLLVVDIEENAPATGILDAVSKQDAAVRQYLEHAQSREILFSRFDPPLAVDDLEMDGDEIIKNMEDILQKHKKIRIPKLRKARIALANTETGIDFVAVYIERVTGASPLFAAATDDSDVRGV